MKLIFGDLYFSPKNMNITRSQVAN